MDENNTPSENQDMTQTAAQNDKTLDTLTIMISKKHAVLLDQLAARMTVMSGLGGMKYTKRTAIEKMVEDKAESLDIDFTELFSSTDH